MKRHIWEGICIPLEVRHDLKRIVCVYNMLPVCVTNMFVCLFLSLLSFPLLSSAYISDFSCTSGMEAAAKNWRGLINTVMQEKSTRKKMVRCVSLYTTCES